MSNQARICAIETKTFKSPIHVPFTISKESKAEAAINVIRITDDQGRIGIGESAPFKTLTNDSVELALQVTEGFAGQLIGKPVSAAIQLLENSAWTIEMRRTSITALAGLGIALRDLGARQHRQSFAQQILSTTLSQRPVLLPDRFEVETDITLPIMNAEAVSDFCVQFAPYNFRVVKIKVSGNPTSDLEMINELFKSFRKMERPLKYSLDGNQGCSVDSALNLLKSLEEVGSQPLCFEQPLPFDDWQGLTRLSQMTSIPICLDETVTTIADCQRAISDQTARMINLKIMKSGFNDCYEIAKLCKKHRLGLMIGGMLESEIAMSASLHLAGAIGGVDQYDLDTPFFYKTHPTKQSPWHAKQASLKLNYDLGLGLELAFDGTALPML